MGFFFITPPHPLLPPVHKSFNPDNEHNFPSETQLFCTDVKIIILHILQGDLVGSHAAIVSSKLWVCHVGKVTELEHL